MAAAEQPITEARLPTVGIAAIVKNEAPYLLEWIAFHQLIGVTAFFIADNESTDGTTELLERLASAGIVAHFLYPTRDEAPQIPAYHEILSRYGNRCDWLAFIDADEFMVPTGKHWSLPKHVAEIANQRAGCIALNWAAYGSSGLATRDDRPVIERFLWRAARDSWINGVFKSIVRPGAVAWFKNPHRVKLRKGFRVIGTDGEALPLSEPWRSDSVCWKGFRLNHYMVKSFEEWQAKHRRGRATHPMNARWPETYFAANDHADERDLFDQALLADTREQMARLAAIADVPLTSKAVPSPALSLSPLAGEATVSSGGSADNADREQDRRHGRK